MSSPTAPDMSRILTTAELRAILDRLMNEEWTPPPFPPPVLQPVPAMPPPVLQPVPAAMPPAAVLQPVAAGSQPLAATGSRESSITPPPPDGIGVMHGATITPADDDGINGGSVAPHAHGSITPPPPIIEPQPVPCCCLEPQRSEAGSIAPEDPESDEEFSWSSATTPPPPPSDYDDDDVLHHVHVVMPGTPTTLPHESDDELFELETASATSSHASVRGPPPRLFF